MKKILFLLMVFLVSSTALAQDPALLEKAKAEGEVNFYANITAIEPIVETFSQDTGVKGLYTRVSTSKYLATVLTEFQAGKLMADVLQAPLPIMNYLKEQGVLAPYAPPAAQSYPDWTRQDDTIQIFGIEYVALIYNKELVKPEDVPKRYEDLTDPKWKDQIVMPDPSTHATTISWLVGLKEKVFPSEAAWRDFLKGLAANRPMFVKSFGPTPAPVESGQKKIAISMPKYIITKAPAPLAWAQVDQPLLGTPRGIAIAKTAPHPNAAKLFMDYWLSKKAMQLLADKVGEYVLHPGVFPPIEGMDKAKVLPVRILSDDEIKQWGAEFKKIFQAS
ncbi:iron(III) transport system substrate-binding protein [Desulfacinum infernum DSM 9756]|uniref:Iron(III) transport system substrate-binding protein n=1 Tax=Desulfacinum infernum DSM 9756 TaxID=1121391 RepID=A0A1M4VPT7_9BACT|nr:extracellular solute-binding protein [Desulfacinum infernum]SHE70885.1 iron(III) transport system substrate-binding protein [Desulfacinum infernum DSM 9756]